MSFETMSKRKTLIRILILANIIIPIFTILVSSASASWLAKSTEIFSPTLKSIDPAMYVDPVSKKMHYSFTIKTAISSDIAYIHNLDGETVMKFGYDDFTNPTYTTPNNYTYCGHSDIYVYNGTVHIVFEAILKGQSVFNIFYTNNSGPSLNFSQNIVNVTGSAIYDSLYPSIVGVNNTIWIAYERETATTKEIFMKTNNGTNYYNESGTEFLVDPVAGGVDNSRPKLHLFKDENNYRIDLVFMRDGNLYGCNTSNGHMPDLNSLAFTIDDTDPIVDFDYDANAELISLGYVGWDTDGEIYARNVTSGGLSAADRFTTNAVNDGNPDVVIDNSNNTHVYYTRNASATDAKLYVRDNHDTPFNVEEELIGYEELPNTDIKNNVIMIYNFDVDIADDAIFVIYAANYERIGVGFTEPHFYTFGYHLFYNYGNDDYQTFSYYEPAIGEYIVESLVLNYDLSGPDWNVTFKFTDLISNATWENNTILPAAGGEQQRIRFYSPDNYFITKNNYTFEILNGSTGNGLLKMDFDPTAIEAYQTYNLTSPAFPNGTHFNYTLFEDFLYFFIEFEFKPINPFTSVPCYAGGYIDGELGLQGGGFDSTNYADLFKFNMIEGDLYNFSYWANTSDINLYFFNDSIQVTKPGYAILNYTSNSTQTQYITFICNETGKYYAFLEDTSFNADSIYYLNYSIAPKAPILYTPADNSYSNSTLIECQWRINPNDEVSDIGGFKIFISDVPTFASHIWVRQDEDQWLYSIIGDYKYYHYFFIIPGNVKYYWRVQAHDKDGNYGLPSDRSVNIDTVAPQAPVLQEPEGVFLSNYVTLNWSEPSDSPFTVQYYNVYVSNSRNGVYTKISTDTYVTHERYTDANKLSDKYYYKVSAVDHVGYESPLSNSIEAIVAIGGWVNARYQHFSVHPGNYFEYQIIDVINKEEADPQKHFISFNDYTFQRNAILHFYIENVNVTDVFPVSGRWYQRPINETTIYPRYIPVDEANANFIPMITSSNTTYQKTICDWFVAKLFTVGFNYTMKNTTFIYGGLVREVVVHSYIGTIDIADKFSSVMFVYDKYTGILIEMTVYDKYDDDGYTIKLIYSSYPLATSVLIWNSVFFIIGLCIIAAIVNQIIKRLEKRV